MSDNENDYKNFNIGPVLEKISKNADSLVDELLAIIYNSDTDPRTKLQAIGMLLDRLIPKLGVDTGKVEASEESGARRKLKAEIEELIQKEMKKGV